MSATAAALPVLSTDPFHYFACEKLRATLTFNACLKRRKATRTVASTKEARPAHPDCHDCELGGSIAAMFPDDGPPRPLPKNARVIPQYRRAPALVAAPRVRHGCDVRLFDDQMLVDELVLVIAELHRRGLLEETSA